MNKKSLSIIYIICSFIGMSIGAMIVQKWFENDSKKKNEDYTDSSGKYYHCLGNGNYEIWPDQNTYIASQITDLYKYCTRDNIFNVTQKED